MILYDIILMTALVSSSILNKLLKYIRLQTFLLIINLINYPVHIINKYQPVIINPLKDLFIQLSYLRYDPYMKTNPIIIPFKIKITPT